MIARRGDVADVDVFRSPRARSRSSFRIERVRLGVGHFFGEIAVLRRSRRSANVTAVSRTSLLVLDAREFHALMDRDPRLSKRVQDVVRSRLRREIVSVEGDIVAEEVEDGEVMKDRE